MSSRHGGGAAEMKEGGRVSKLSRPGETGFSN